MMVRWPRASSSSGALTTRTLLARFAGGSTWAAPWFGRTRHATVIAITSVTTSFLIEFVIVASFALPNQGMAGSGRGGMAQTLSEQGGSVGVAMRVSLPWADAEPPVMH